VLNVPRKHIRQGAASFAKPSLSHYGRDLKIRVHPPGVFLLKGSPNYGILGESFDELPVQYPDGTGRSVETK
jgi:hypothetical protein